MKLPKPCTAEAYDLGCICSMPPLFEGGKKKSGVIVDLSCPIHGLFMDEKYQDKEYELAHMWLDDHDVPRADGMGEVYSLVGRICIAIAMAEKGLLT